ncbi:MAG: glycosyltransferase family 4 protein [Helicobacter sp.]|nr:glycosyltransferase family 4 protein [Helicobacter sp.]MCI7485852.1 glycosyltransferase family 4 protein [Helicobacter sp.]MDD7567198.1 glycosyltransferase family 4 protein [Helicobacter sp.]MDY5740107.1 glycosyltransferase family 4 protein [Helicobacter sp.]
MKTQTSHANTQQKLAFVANTAQGMLNFRLEVLQALQKMGYEIHILAPIFESTRDLCHAAMALKQNGFILHHIQVDSQGLNPFKDLLLAYVIFKYLRLLKPQMVFSYTIKPVIYASLVANLLKIPHIAIITGLGFVFIGDGIKKCILRKFVCLMYSVSLKGCFRVWFLNADDKDEFLKRKILAPKKADLLASEGVNTEFFSPDSQSPHDTQTFIFLLPARMLWDKGVGEFVQAAKILRSSQDIRFYLLGQSDCQNPQAISREQIMQWENEGLITYLGFASDVRAIIKASSCVVLPSYREGVSVALLEAMSMAKPIITSNTPGCKEMVIEGYNGFLCEPRDSRSLASCMQKMLSLKHEQLIELGQNSRNIALSRYDRKLTIARYKQILDQALK